MPGNVCYSVSCFVILVFLCVIAFFVFLLTYKLTFSLGKICEVILKVFLPFSRLNKIKYSKLIFSVSYKIAYTTTSQIWPSVFDQNLFWRNYNFSLFLLIIIKHEKTYPYIIFHGYWIRVLRNIMSS